MSGPAFLARRYLGAHPFQSLGITLALSMALFLPAATWLLGERLEAGVMARAQATPLIVGAKGDTFDLTLGALYFQGAPQGHVPAGLAGEIRAGGGVDVAALQLGHSAGGAPVVGVDPGYFALRGVAPAEGRLPALLGEAVIGAALAQERGIGVGEGIVTDQVNPYNLAGAYPFRLPVVGVLGETGGPEDHALFVDLKTAWLLDGALHGHGEEASAQSPSAASAPELNPFLFNTLTPENRASFHLHGDADAMPVSALLLFPRERRVHDQLLGRFALDPERDAIRPGKVMARVMALVFRLRQGLLTLLAGISALTLGLVGSLMALSLRLRRGELALMARLGASRGRIAAVIALEAGAYLLGAALVSALALAFCVYGLDLMEILP